jgi:hypothetical protein
MILYMPHLLTKVIKGRVFKFELPFISSSLFLFYFTCTVLRHRSNLLEIKRGPRSFRTKNWRTPHPFVDLNLTYVQKNVENREKLPKALYYR